MAKKILFAYVTSNEPQLSVWDSREEAEESAVEAEECGSNPSDVFEFEEPTTPEEAYSLVDLALDHFNSEGH